MTIDLAVELSRFDTDLPVERARTPPASWYTAPELAAHEARALFGDEWIAVALAQELSVPGTQLAVTLTGLPLLLVRQLDGSLAGFHNACRHHATQLVSARACGDTIRCPYHGWTYALDGSLATAPRMAGVQGFDSAANGLVPVALREALGLVFVHLGAPPPELPAELARAEALLAQAGAQGLSFRARRSYSLACDWKVFVDNYLDGGYHVEALHPALAGLLDLTRYRTEVDGRLVLQSCPAAPGAHRLGREAEYLFVFPNLMLNSYGDVLDVNRVVPAGPGRCEVIIDWAFSPDASDEAIARCISESEQVQQEDIDVCEAVQRGLASPAYGSGRYAPRLERGAHSFHRELAERLRLGLESGRNRA